VRYISGVSSIEVLWRRLDVPGHEACRLYQAERRYHLEGAAVFLEDARPARLDYVVSVDLAFGNPRARVRGWHGARSLDVSVERGSDGSWIWDGRALPGLADCLDFDLGFSPATNLLQLRRLALEPGQAAEAPAAWFDLSQDTLTRLQQRYERVDAHRYNYTSPSASYAATLEVGEHGFVRVYPGLWEQLA